MRMKKICDYPFIQTGWSAKLIVLGIVVFANINLLQGQIVGGKDRIILNKEINFSLTQDSVRSATKPSDREAQVGYTIEELIAGRISGARIVKSDGMPGAAFSLQVRGVRSFRGDNEPVYILDGVVLNPVWNDAMTTFWNDPQDYQATQNILSRINTNDIEKIEILKNADATAIYGNQGANGVVLITTKRGKKDGFSYNVQANLGFSVINSEIDVLNGSDYLKYQNIANPGNSLPFELRGPMNWQNDVSRVGIMQNYHVDFGGSNNKTNYYISINYLNNEGVIDRSDITQASIRVNFDRLIGNHTIFGTRMLFGYTENNMIQATSPFGSPSLTKLMTKAIPFETSADDDYMINENPRDWIRAYDDNSVQYFATPQVYFATSIFNGLKLKTVGGIDYRTKERFRWIGSEIARGRSVEGRAGRSNINLMTYNIDSHLKYSYNLEKHTVTSLLGASINGEYISNQMNEGTTFFNQDLRGIGIQLAENTFPYRNLEWSNYVLSGYFSGSYMYDNKYTLRVSVRTDKTNKFDEAFNSLTYYPSLGFSWNIKNEGFLADQDIVSRLILRGSWGRSGKQTLLPFDLTGHYITGFTPEVVIENDMTNYYDLRWNNKNTQKDISFDIGFLEDRITASVDLYNSDSKDILRYYYHERLGAYETAFSNESSTNNKGIEVSLNAELIKNSDVTLNVGATLAYNKSKITNTGYNADLFGNSIGMKDEAPFSVNVNRKGEQVGAFWGYKSQGIVEDSHVLFAPPFNNVRLQSGDIKFIDINGDGNITEEDKTIIGNPIPEYVFGVNTDFRYKKLSVKMLFEGMAKYDIVNMDLYNDIYITGNIWNLRENTYTDSYSATNTDGKSPRFNAVGINEFSSRVIEDGSYIRLSDFIVGYNLNLPMVKWINSLDLTFAMKNLLLITNYSGFDPNVNSYSYNLSLIGIDNAAYPSARSFIVGVKVNF